MISSDRWFPETLRLYTCLQYSPLFFAETRRKAKSNFTPNILFHPLYYDLDFIVTIQRFFFF